MSITPTSTIALVTSKTSSKINFAHVVGEMRRSLARSQHNGYTQTWDHDDIATFDFEGTRIVLALEEEAISIHETTPDCLFISVGPSFAAPHGQEPKIAYEQMCSMIVERVCTCYEIKPVYWMQIPGSVTSEIVDDFFQDIAPTQSKSTNVDLEDPAIVVEPERPPHENVIHMSAASNRSAQFRAKGAGRQQAGAAFNGNDPVDIANDVAPGPYHDSDRLRAIRAALYDAPDQPNSVGSQKNSTFVRFTTIALDTTMVVVCLPVGVAMLGYHIYNGGDLRRSAQAITLTGFMLAYSNMIPAMPLSMLFS
ncbi:hypothetical protein ACEN2J_02445 [Pseudorhodobacter sp. W20_MBD10_FR17]|uniref:hypothetical protein n=1 Tax=Pseudorhodobacter sp. W20_MBD10_FR17 TaxID=3240266 RepID=UPI003F970CBC